MASICPDISVIFDHTLAARPCARFLAGDGFGPRYSPVSHQAAVEVVGSAAASTCM